MKISKVNHKRTAVVVKNGQEMPGTGGVVYQSPGKEIKDLHKDLENRARNVKNLYSIFNQIQSGTAPKNHSAIQKESEAERDARNIKLRNYILRTASASYINQTVNSIEGRKISYRSMINHMIGDCTDKKLPDAELVRKINNGAKGFSDFGQMIKKTAEKVRFEVPAEVIKDLGLKDFVTIALRKSILDTAAKRPGFDVREAAVVFLQNTGRDHISSEDLQKIRYFLSVVREDYHKWDPQASGKDRFAGTKRTGAEKATRASRAELTIRAIENQNMIVQPKAGRLSLSPISDKGKNPDAKTKKRYEKGGLNEFLLSYAQLDENQRMNDLRKLRRLVDVYFGAPAEFKCGDPIEMPDTVDKSPEFNVWHKHSEAKRDERLFAEIPSELQEAAEHHKQLDAAVQKQKLEELKRNIRERNIRGYRFTYVITNSDPYKELFFENASINQFWIHHIENAVERILKQCATGTLFKLKLGYLSEKVWKDTLNLLSIKYIALGKAVYHFAMEDMTMTKDKADLKLGRLKDSIARGITSFDYEMIKAQEDLQRETAVSVAFAVNNFARATMNLTVKNDKNHQASDVLLWSKRNKEEKGNPNVQRKYTQKGATLAAILQFFGGQSAWDPDLFMSAYEGDEDYELAFWDDLRKALFAARNDSFHFKTAVHDEGWNTGLVGEMFAKDADTCLTIEKDKFYSNNLHMFYSDQDLHRMLDRLYEKEVSRAAQVPGFNTILPRKTMPDFMKILGAVMPPYDAETLDQWYSACYYLLKEVYYNLFLSAPEAKSLFDTAVQNLKKESEHAQKDVKNAAENFIKRYDGFGNAAMSLKGRSLAEICQTYMTDYNQQNNQFRKVRSAEDSILHEPIYQHYKLLLKKVMLSAFAAYVRDEKNGLKFLMKPKKKSSVVRQEDFLSDWRSSKYQKLVKTVRQQSELQKWYIVGRFMNARMLNLLLGSMRSYLQYTDDIRKRAKILKSELHVPMDNEEMEAVRNRIRILELCLLLSGRISNQVSDYFIAQENADHRTENAEERAREAYAEYLAKYVAFSDPNMPSSYSALKKFSENAKIDFYIDAENPKVNRNIVQARLFAPDSILSAESRGVRVIERISKEEIHTYDEKKKKLDEARNKGAEVSCEEQQNILAYQKIKNRLELRDLVEYGELINELLGQLINWSFMRERDLLYFQLGFHYCCLMNASEKPDAYTNIETADGKTIENAVLYQVMAMYICGYPVYTTKEKKGFRKGNAVGGTGGKVSDFLEYTEEMNLAKEQVYNAGLELFENITEHDSITELRNEIDHFRYYQGRRSLRDLYGEVFDRFFTYDLKYRKNVLNQFSNILLRHHVIAKLEIRTKENGKKIIKEEIIKEDGKERKKCTDVKKDRAEFLIKELKSDRFIYKCKNTLLETDAKDQRYLKTMARILYYPDCEEGKEPDDVKIISRKDLIKSPNKKNRTGDQRRKQQLWWQRTQCHSR